MKRALLAVLAAFTMSVAPSPTLDPPPGDFIGQKTAVTNPFQEEITVSGTTSIKLNAPVTLGVGKSLQLIWDGVYWIGVGFKPGRASFSHDFPATAIGACVHGPSFAIVGALVGDGCVASSNFGMDGGALIPEDVVVSCEIDGQGTGHVNLCSHLPTDGGVGGFNLPDAGWYMRAVK